MNHKVFSILILFLLLSVSCMKEIDLEYLRPDPKLVLNCVTMAGEPVNASLSRTWFYTEDNPNVVIKDANMKLYVNGQFTEQMKYIEQQPDDSAYYNNIGYYTANYKPVTGDQIRITAEAEGFKQVSAETVIPKVVPINDFSVISKKIEEYGYYTYENQYHVTFTDDPARKDFYLIRFEEGYPARIYDPETGEYVYTGGYSWTNLYLDFATDPLFTSQITALDKVMGYDWLSGYYGRVFSDDLINGKEYTIKLKSNTSVYYASDPEEEYSSFLFRVTLYAIDESYYQYMKSIIDIYDDSLDRDLSDVGLSEPIRIYSNIIGGTGILGGGNPYRKTVELPH